MLVFEHLINAISLGSIYALLALGYSLAFGVLRMINFAHSEIYMVSAFTGFYADKLFQLSHQGWFGLMLLAAISLVTGGVLALVVERFAYRPLEQAPRINILITAIGVSLFLQYSAQLIFGADPKFYQLSIENKSLMSFGNIHVMLYDVLILAVTFSVLLTLHFFIQGSLFGKGMRAISYSSQIARYLGLPVSRIVSRTFFIGGVLAATAALLVPLKYPKIDPMMGVFMGLKAFIAAVLGGIGNLYGAVLGAFLLGLVEQFVAAYISSTYRDALAFLILIAVLWFKPQGLLGKAVLEKV